VLTGYKEEANPEYNIAQNQINNARLSVQQAAMGKMSADSQYCAGLACFVKIIGQVAAQAVVTKAQKNLNGAMTKLGNTPQMLKHPIYAKYKFDKASIKANKSLTVHYYVVDMVEGKYFKSSFDVIENKSFEVAYRVLDDDPNKVSHISKNNTEKDVTDWEEAASSIKLSMMIEHYMKNIESSQQLPNIAQLRTEMLEDKNTALAKYKSEKYNARPLNDPRFDHVVVVYTGSGSFGSGFFIKDDIVLTNWHVVENSAFVEMKTYDGQETFGKIIAKDVRVDLALVKVQTRGKPVIFYTKNTIDLGQTVEAIGHPKGLEFSITRGVVSAIREHPSINLPVGGADDVLFIQIDTPINPGNSGGPLFLGDKVVGVNTWGLKKNIAEGLNFAVHYSEVIKFIRENVPSFPTSQR
jgi:serine protease Do